MMHHIYAHLTKELDKKADKGIQNTSDLDVVVKLTEAMKNIAKTEYYCTVTEAMQEGEYSHEGGDYSERRHRDRMGRYARDGGYDRGSSYAREGGYARDGGYSEARGDYMEAKHSYRSTRSPDAKKAVAASLEECMTKLGAELDNMEADADTREERERIRELRRMIARVA